VVDGEGKIQLFNRACELATGYRFEEVRGRSALDLLLPPDEAPRLAETVRALLKDGLPVEIENHWVAKDGSRRLIAWSDNVVRRADGSVEWVIGTGIDVTEHRRLQEQLRQAQKLESVARLAGGVAHDFNNLLTIILSCAESLEGVIANGGSASLGEVGEITAAARRAAELTGHLLTFARKQTVIPIPTNLGDAVRRSERLLRRILGEDIGVIVRTDAATWLVEGDQGQLEQIILNLAVNARDAMPRGGTLTIEAEDVAIRGDEPTPDPDVAPGEYVRLTVKDSGAGMPAEVKAHLFEPFFTTKPTGRGTGLGLATVYGIVKQSGGAIRVESAPDQGTTFEVYFPRTLRTNTPTTAAAPLPAPGGGTEPILFVEDDVHVREIAVRALRAAGYEVIVPPTSKDALRLTPATLQRARLLITDVVMPGVDGRALADELGRKSERLRVLFTSGYTPDEVADRGVVESGMHFLPKPYTGATLLARVRTVLDAPW